MLSKLIFTYVFDDYDTLRDPKVLTPGWKYYCLSDSDLESEVWAPVDVTHHMSNEKCPKRKASLMKINHYEYVPEHFDLIMTLDGSMLLNTDLNKFVDDYWEHDADLLIAIHPKRDCIYKEADAVLKYNLDDPMIIYDQINRYLSMGFPENFGLYGTRMMLKNNNSPKLKRVCEIWTQEYKNGSRRDQLSLNYAIWKAKKEGIELKIIGMNFNYLYRESGKFIINGHNKSGKWQ